MTPISVVLAEDHELVRAGVRTLLQQAPGIQLVAEAADGSEALRVVEEHRPDVALIDVRMPSINGLEVAARIVEQQPEVRVIMLSVYDDEDYVLQAIRCGATGYLLKDATTTELIRAIETVAAGDIYLSGGVSQHVLTDSARQHPAENLSSTASQLTERQTEILQLIAQGVTTIDIARKLAISPKTVETHRAQIMERLDIHNVPGLTRFAIQNGLIS